MRLSVCSGVAHHTHEARQTLAVTVLAAGFRVLLLAATFRIGPLS
jgi:hypothetical protein